MVSNYDMAVQAIGHRGTEVEDLDRVQLTKGGGIDFCLNSTTYLCWEEHELIERNALDDQRLPLANWAITQPSNRIRLLAYRPNRRIVILDKARNTVLKGYRKSKQVEAAERHYIAQKTVTTAELRTPVLLGVDAERSCTVMTHCTGIPLHLVSSSLETLQQLGRHLGKMSQVAHDDLFTGLEQHSAQQELALVHDLGARVWNTCGKLPENWPQTYAKFSRQPPKPKFGLAHRDLHDGQFVYKETTPTLFDFDLLCLADPMLDLGNLLAHVELRLRQQSYRDSGARKLRCTAIVEGFRQQQQINHQHLAWYRSASLLRLALVYFIRPKWRHLANGLVSSAKSHIQYAQQQKKDTQYAG